jgi:hypothetical protein
VKTLEQAREERLDREIDGMIADKLKNATNLAAPISPAARVKLRGILKKYAKSPHPFRACVKDNMEIFLDARALEEHGTTEAVALLEVKGASELQRWGVGHEELVKLEAS